MTNLDLSKIELRHIPALLRQQILSGIQDDCVNCLKSNYLLFDELAQSLTQKENLLTTQSSSQEQLAKVITTFSRHGSAIPALPSIVVVTLTGELLSDFLGRPYIQLTRPWYRRLFFKENLSTISFFFTTNHQVLTQSASTLEQLINQMLTEFTEHYATKSTDLALPHQAPLSECNTPISHNLATSYTQSQSQDMDNSRLVNMQNKTNTAHDSDREGITNSDNLQNIKNHAASSLDTDLPTLDSVQTVDLSSLESYTTTETILEQQETNTLSQTSDKLQQLNTVQESMLSTELSANHQLNQSTKQSQLKAEQLPQSASLHETDKTNATLSVDSSLQNNISQQQSLALNYELKLSKDSTLNKDIIISHDLSHEPAYNLQQELNNAQGLDYGQQLSSLQELYLNAVTNIEHQQHNISQNLQLITKSTTSLEKALSSQDVTPNVVIHKTSEQFEHVQQESTESQDSNDNSILQLNIKSDSSLTAPNNQMQEHTIKPSLDELSKQESNNQIETTSDKLNQSQAIDSVVSHSSHTNEFVANNQFINYKPEMSVYLADIYKVFQQPEMLKLRRVYINSKRIPLSELSLT